MPYDYDDQNVFAKILRGEIPNNTLLETEHTLAFHDVSPQAPDHVLVIPKGPYVCYDHFADEASDEEIIDFTRAIGEACRMLGLKPGEGADGYRMIGNSGNNGVQEVQHLHIHILGGRWMGRMVSKPRVDPA